MKTGIVLGLVGAVAVGVLSGAGGQPTEPPKPTGHAPAEIDVRPKAPKETGNAVVEASDCLTKLAFLQGTWAGPMHGDPVDETWGSPAGDSLIGMFRWIANGKTTMYEMLSIKAEGDTPVLRLRHFGADFVPWKGECDSLAFLKATEITATKVVFTNESGIGGLASCRYERAGDVLKVKVSFKDEKREALDFELKRQ